MKVLLYSEMMDKIGKSGLGHAIYHQQKALDLVGVDYTIDPNDDFDLLHINTYFPKSYLLARECKKKGIPVIYHAHSTMEDFCKSFKGSDLVAPLFKEWLKWCYSLGDVIITPTDYSKSILKSYGLDQPIYAVSNGINLKSFKEIPNAREVLQKEYSYKAEDFIIMGVGLYIERKGILDFIELAKELPEYKFIWFGYTDKKLIPEHIQQSIENHSSNLNFAGYVPNEKIKLALQACDVFLMPTLEETEGIPAIEACASKTKMIIRDIPVFDDWLIDGYNVYKARDIKEFKEKLILIYNDKLPDLTEEAYKVAEERDLLEVGKQLKDIYESVYKKSLMYI